MDLSIKFTDMGKKVMFMKMGGFTLTEEDGTAVATYDTGIPGGTPIITIWKGIHAGKTFVLKLENLEKFTRKLLEDEEETKEPKPKNGEK